MNWILRHNVLTATIVGALLAAVLLGTAGCTKVGTLDGQEVKSEYTARPAKVLRVNGSVALIRFDDGVIAAAMNPYEELKVGDVVNGTNGPHRNAEVLTIR